MRSVDIVYFNAGGGHRAAAQALTQAITDRGLPWQVRTVNLFELIDPLRTFERTVGVPPETYYNRRLSSGITVGLAQELKVLQAAIRWAHPLLVERLLAWWRRSSPDLVVSVIPNFNRCLVESLALARPQAVYVTVLTDIADFPPRFWIERDVRQHLVVGSERAARQAVELGRDPAQVHRVSGMVLRPSFYEAAAAAHRRGPVADPAAEARRRAARQGAGLDPDRPTGLVMFGGAGSRQMKRIATELPDTPLILMCGRNAALARQLRALPARAPRVVVGFTDDVAHWMALADFFIGKPGPGSLSEAVHCGLPVITTLNTWTLPQERYNADWVREQGVGVAIPSFRRIGAAVADVIARLPQLRSRVARLDNRAVFEIPAILESLLEAAGRPSPTRHEPVIGRSRPALTMMACDETNSPP